MLAIWMRVLYNNHTMTPSKKKQTAFRIDAEIIAGLQAIKERDGVPLSEQVRRALNAWLTEKGAVKAERKRPNMRRITRVKGGA